MPISISLANVLCSVFVDGGYVREEMKRQQLPYEFDPREPGRWLSAQKIVIGARIVVPDRTHYYDGIDDSPVTPEAIAQADKFDEYLSRVAALYEVRVGNPGYLRRTQKKREQKGVDVQLTVDALEWAFCSKGWGDSDRDGRRRFRASPGRHSPRRTLRDLAGLRWACRQGTVGCSRKSRIPPRPNKRLASEGLIAVHSEQPTPEQGIRDVKHPRPRR
jgi:hypothetical protein